MSMDDGSGLSKGFYFARRITPRRRFKRSFGFGARGILRIAEARTPDPVPRGYRPCEHPRRPSTALFLLDVVRSYGGLDYLYRLVGIAMRTWSDVI